MEFKHFALRGAKSLSQAKHYARRWRWQEAQMRRQAHSLARRMRCTREQFYFGNCENPVVLKYPYSAELEFNRLHKHVVKPVGGKRGLINTFSPAAAKRFRRCVNRSPVPFTYFLTVTFPPDIWWHWQDKGGWRGYVRYFMQEFRKMAKAHRATYIWVREPQKNGRPHYHILCDKGVEMQKAACAINARFLSEARARINEKNIRLEFMRTRQGAAAYMAKAVAYCVKEIAKFHEESWRHWGRNFRDAVAEICESTFEILEWLKKKVFPRIRENRFPMNFNLPSSLPIGPPLPW